MKQGQIILAGFAVGIVATIMVGVFAMQSSSRYSDSARLVEESQRVRAMLLELGQTASQAKSDNYSYVLSGNDKYREAYSKSESAVRSLLSQLKDARPDQTSMSMLNNLDQVVGQQFQVMDKAVNAYRSRGSDAAVQVLNHSDDAQESESESDLISKLEDAEHTKLNEVSIQTEEDKKKAMMLVPIGILISLLGVVGAALMVIRDNSRRLQAELALSKSHAIQRAILDAANVSVVSTDSEGKVTTFNKASERMLGYRSEEMIGSSPSRLSDPTVINTLGPQIGVTSTAEIFTKTAPKGLLETDWAFVRKDGSKFPVSLAVAPLRDEDGQIFGHVAIASDLTERQISEQKIAQHIKELEVAREDLADKNRLLEEIADDLKSSRDEAVSATNAKSEFLANMSHEIRTPLNGVLGTTHLLLNTELNDKQRSFVQLIHRSAESLLSILNDILDLSKMEAGKMSLESAPFNLRETLEDVAEQFASVAHQKGLELNLLAPPHASFHLVGDSTRVRQVVTNLVANAIKFTERGHVDIKVQQVREDPGTVCYKVSVIDTGIGIPTEKLQSIFESFTQADGATARKFGGTGLGLAISRQLVEMMQGDINVESRAGEGSEFWFEITFEKQSPDQIEVDKRDLGGINVLVADDNETNRLVVRGLLEAWNCNVESVQAGKEALDHIAKENFDCAVLDLLMPGDDGIAIARQIRKSKRTRDLPIVLISSAHIQPTDSESVGLFQAVLTKPVRSSVFYEAVAKAVKMGVQREEPQGRSAQDSLKQVRVLVVEDNPINQLVVTEMLKSWGCTVIAVDNGRRAVDRLAVDSFDVILMDVQMPEMDGLEATRHIRKREQTLETHIPIIAMTANAMKGDEERCLQAGMDAYLSKPIQPQLLADTMSKYAGHEVTVIEEEVAEPKEVHPIFDIEQLNQTTSGRADLQQRILERYLESLNPQIAKLEDSINLMERKDIKSIAHSLKGSSWTVGASTIADVFRRIEIGSETMSAGAFGELMTEVNNDVTEVRIQIQGFLAQVAATQK